MLLAGAGKVTPHQLNIPVANLAASEAGNAIVLLLLLLVKVLTSYECPSQLNVPIADPKRHSRSRKSRSAPGQAADSSATDDGQTGERMLTDGTCADAVRMTLARFKQLLGEQQYRISELDLHLCSVRLHTNGGHRSDESHSAVTSALHVFHLSAKLKQQATCFLQSQEANTDSEPNRL